MLPIEEVKKWLIENRTDKYGDLDLSRLDFSDFKGNIHIGGWKVGGNLFQGFQDVGGNLFQGHQRVYGSLSQNYQGVDGSLYQDNQKVGRNLFQDHQEVEGDINQSDQCWNGYLYQGIADNNHPISMQGSIEPEAQGRKDECECVEPNYKAEYERLRKELYEADRKIETLLWALEKAMEASK